MRAFVGIDPGVTGFIGWMKFAPEEWDRPERWDMGVRPLPQDGQALAEAMNDLLCDVPQGSESVVVELVTPRVPFSIQSQWKLAISFGTICGTLSLLRQPYVLALPRIWQGHLGCLTKGDKHVSAGFIRDLYPATKVTLKSCDALCIAEYARRKEWPVATPAAVGP